MVAFEGVKEGGRRGWAAKNLEEDPAVLQWSQLRQDMGMGVQKTQRADQGEDGGAHGARACTGQLT